MPFQFQLPTQGGLEEEVAPEALLSLEVKAVHLLSLEVKAVHLLINLVKKVEQTYDLLSLRLLGIEAALTLYVIIWVQLMSKRLEIYNDICSGRILYSEGYHKY